MVTRMSQAANLIVSADFFGSQRYFEQARPDVLSVPAGGSV